MKTLFEQPTGQGDVTEALKFTKLCPSTFLDFKNISSRIDLFLKEIALLIFITNSRICEAKSRFITMKITKNNRKGVKKNHVLTNVICKHPLVE